MIAGAALSERSRLIVAGGGLAAVALLWLVQPWRYLDAFVYPPHARMLLLPFGALPSGAALAIWLALNLFCLHRAGELLDARHDGVLLALLAPATLVMVATGYPAGFLALMAALVVVQGHRHPGRAGLCLALMTVHPPLALLGAVLLAVLGCWRIMAAGAAWTAALLGASLITAGPHAWAEYLGAARAAGAGGLL